MTEEVFLHLRASAFTSAYLSLIEEFKKLSLFPYLIINGDMFEFLNVEKLLLMYDKF